MVELTISEQMFKQELIIVNSLTSEGILGLNFLEANGCILDLVRGELITRGSRVALSAKNSEPTTAQVEICIQESFTVAGFSEMEVMGEIPLACKGNWLVENKESKKPQVLIARAIVAWSCAPTCVKS